MGRSISTARGAVEVLYFEMPFDSFVEEQVAYLREDGQPDAGPDDVSQSSIDQDAEHAFHDVADEVALTLAERYSSFVPEDDEWSGRENRVIASNGLTDVLVSEYGGIVAVSIAPITAREDLGHEFDDGERALREAWTRRMAPHIAKVVRKAVWLEEYEKMGTFSDGTTAYTKAA